MESKSFGGGKIWIGELTLAHVYSMDTIWKAESGLSFCKPNHLPNDYYVIGHFIVPYAKSQSPFIVVGITLENNQPSSSLPPLEKPLDYNLVWSSSKSHVSFWLPVAPQGYKPLGCIVSKNSDNKPSLEEVRCVRSDLSEDSEIDNLMFSEGQFKCWSVRPKTREVNSPGMYLGTFYCSTNASTQELPIACLSNKGDLVEAMPSIEQLHNLVQKHGPSLVLHSKEMYFPSSVNWFFSNGALLYTKDSKKPPERISFDGANLPQGGGNDGEYWMDLPSEESAAQRVKNGDLQSAVAYVHAKAMMGGTCTDLVFWVFYPFNGAATLKALGLDIHLQKLGEHVGDWEHCTLRFNNFTGNLWRVFLAQHSGGQWLDANEIEFSSGTNKAMVYSSRHSHATYPRAGEFVVGEGELGISVRDTTSRSSFVLDCSRDYQIISASYLKDGMALKEPPWLQFMREWGPKIEYDVGQELEKIEKVLPKSFRRAIERFLNKLPDELLGEEGPLGPKAKSSWIGDEVTRTSMRKLSKQEEYLMEKVGV